MASEIVLGLVAVGLFVGTNVDQDIPTSIRLEMLETYDGIPWQFQEGLPGSIRIAPLP